MSMEVVIENIEHDSSLVKSFASYYEKDNYLDVTFVCKGGRQVGANKLVLSTVSPFLKHVFLALDGNQDVITISVPDVDHNILKLLFDFVYDGTTKLSETEFIEFKAIQKMLDIRFLGVVANECHIAQFPRAPPPPMVKLNKRILPGPQIKSATHTSNNNNNNNNNNNIMERQEPATAAVSNDSCLSKINAKQPSNPVHQPLPPNISSRHQDDDPLNVPDYYAVITTAGRSTMQAEGGNINSNGGIVPSEAGQDSHHDTASSSSPMSQQGTGPVNNHGVHSSKVRQHSASSVRKRPHTQTGSDTKHFAGVSKCKTQK